MSPETCKFIVFISGLVVMGIVESAWPYRTWETPRTKRLGVHASLAIFNTLFLKLTVAAPFIWFSHLISENQWGLRRLLMIPDGLLEIVLSLIVLDYMDYWWHRFNHQIPFLWRFHKVHHSDTHVDITSSLRFHPGELFISAFVKCMWIFLWGPSVWGFIIFEMGISMASQFHHSNIRFSPWWEKWVGLFFVTPLVHCAHHTVARRSGDANYATIFRLWDRCHGSFATPDEEEMKSLGIPELNEKDRAHYLEVKKILTQPLC